MRFIVICCSLQKGVQRLPYVSWSVASNDKQSNDGFQGRHTALGFVVTFLLNRKLMFINRLCLWRIERRGVVNIPLDIHQHIYMYIQIRISSETELLPQQPPPPTDDIMIIASARQTIITQVCRLRFQVVIVLFVTLLPSHFRHVDYHTIETLGTLGWPFNVAVSGVMLIATLQQLHAVCLTSDDRLQNSNTVN